MGPSTAGGGELGPTWCWALGAAGVWGHCGISLGVLRSLLWCIQGTKALQNPWFNNCSLFQCQGPPPVP